MKFESEREEQEFSQVMRGIRDIIRHLDDIKAEKNADLGRGLHTALNKLRKGLYLKERALTVQESIEKTPK